MPAGAHQHDPTPQGPGLTGGGGPHAHGFMIDGVLVTTDAGGEHVHQDQGNTTPNDGQHFHTGTLPDGTPFRTRDGGLHSHPTVEGQTGPGTPHGHDLELDSVLISSDTPSPTRRVVEMTDAHMAKAHGPITGMTAAQLKDMSDEELQALDQRLHRLAEAVQ